MALSIKDALKEWDDFHKPWEVGSWRDKVENAELGSPFHGLKAGYKLHNFMSPTVHINDRIHDLKKNGSDGHITRARESMHDYGNEAWKENWPVATAYLAGAGLSGGLGGASGGAAGGGTSGLGAAPTAGSFMPGTAAPAGIETVTVTGSAGGLSAAETAAMAAAAGAGAVQNPDMGMEQPKSGGFNLKDFMQQGLGGGQQQQQTSPAPQNAAPQRRGLGGVMDKIGAGLFPVDSRAAAAIGPEALAQQRNQALMRMGLGMMSASSQGAGLGESALFGMNNAQQSLDGALQRGYENAREARAEQRQSERDAASDERYSNERQYQLDRDVIEDARAESQMAAQAEQRKMQLEQQKAQQAALAQYRADTLAARQANKDSKGPEVRVTDRGMFEQQKDGSWKLVPGTEPTGVAGRPIPQGMANDFKTNATVMGQIDKILPQLKTQDGKAYSQKASDAFGARNAVIDALTPDAVSDNVKNFVDSEGTDLRATVTNLNSYIVKERNGAAVTVAEFARQRGFLPTDKDSVEIIETKLKNLRDALASEQQYLADFAESQGYKPPPMEVRPRSGASGGWSIRPAGQ
jgi:hypothetical protein